MNRGMKDTVEIICPCGEILVKEPGDDRVEFECPSCKRINVLPPGDSSRPPSREGGPSPGGDRVTTTLELPRPGDIAIGSSLGPYSVTGVIGEGGMGKVYIAVDQKLQRNVALKILSGKLREQKDFVARFQREARSVARLNNPHIVQIYYTDTWKGIPYYAMELVDGENLDRLLRREGPLDPDRAIDLMIQASRGLAAAAAQGVIHRDVKPSNMVLDKKGTLKITDFGLARIASSQSSLTLTGAIVGTPYYMSPEQGESRPLDYRTDVYSLGASFYHLLTGSPPYEAESPVGIILRHIRDDLPPPDSRNPKIPAALSAVIRKMMSKKKDDRYTSYEALIADLESLKTGRAPALSSEQGRGRDKSKDQQRSKGVRRIPSYVIEEREAPASEEIRLVRAGLLRRFLAWAGDFAVLSALYNLESGVFRYWLWDAVFLLFVFFYFFISDAKGGVTLGKTFFRCRVGKASGEDLGWVAAFFRTLLFYPVLFGMGAKFPILFIESWDQGGNAFCRALDGLARASETAQPTIVPTLGTICLAWLLIDVGYLFMSPEKRTLHDMAAGAFYFARKKAKIKPKKKPKEKHMGKGRGPLHHLFHRKKKEEGQSLRPGPRRKDPVFAAVLSAMLPGLGQFYNGDTRKGILVLLTFWLILPYFYGIRQAHTGAEEINKQASPEA